MEECSSQNNTTMQTRIQLTIKDEDKDELFAKEVELDELVERMITEYVTFPVDVQIYPQEPEIEILYPSWKKY